MKSVHPLIVAVSPSKKITQRLNQLLKKDFGLNLKTSESGLESLQIMEKNHPVLFILDDMVKDIKPRALCESIRSHAHFHDMPIALISTLENEDVVRLMFETPRIHHLNKPLHDDEVIETVTDLLQHFVYFERMLKRAANG